MAHVHADRVADTTTTTGTGAITLSASPPTGYRTFSAVMATSDTCYYAIASANSSEWEVGIGTYSGVNTLTRTTVLASSNSNTAVSFSAGTKDVFITDPAARDNGTLYNATTNTAIAKFNGTDGNIQNSGVLIDASNNITGVAKFSASGYSLTGSDASSLLDLSGTWNTTGIPTALKLNVTDTASNASSLLMDLQVGGSSKFKINKDAALFLAQSNSGVTSGAGIATLNSTADISFYYNGTRQAAFNGTSVLYLFNNNASIQLGASQDLVLTRRAAANWRLGNTDVAAPVAQTLSVQSVVAGTSNTAGTNFTITGSQGTGTGAGGSIIFQTAAAGSSGTAQNALATALTINSSSQTLAADGSASLPSLSFNNANNCGFYRAFANQFEIAAAGTRVGAFLNTGLFLFANAGLSLAGSGGGTSSILIWDDNYTIGQRSSTNACTLRVYNTYTSATNYERAKIEWSSNVLNIGTEKGSGGGTARSLAFQTDGTTRITIDAITGNTGIGISPTAVLHVKAGSATANTAPIKFTSGTNLTTVEAGVVEYDGTITTITPSTNYGRAAVPLTNYTSGAGSALGTNTEATNAVLLPAGNDAITLPLGTYFIETSYTVTRGATSTTSATARINLRGTGTAAGTFSGMSMSAPTAGGATANFSFSAVTITTDNVLTAASTTAAGVYTIHLRGILKITTAGTIIPQYSLSANINAAGTVSSVLYFKIQQLDTQNAAAFGPAGAGWV